jgi:hypothetical protein
VAATEDLYESTRREVEHFLAENPASEEALEEVLDLISSHASDDLGPLARQEPGEDQAWEMLAAVDAWASLASYAFQRIYTEESMAVGTPFIQFPGTKKSVMQRLQSVSSKLRPALEKACRGLGALSYSISVGFPAGVSVGISWQP